MVPMRLLPSVSVEEMEEHHLIRERNIMSSRIEQSQCMSAIYLLKKRSAKLVNSPNSVGIFPERLLSPDFFGKNGETLYS